jgi:very-short-patch-repair endonuclease
MAAVLAAGPTAAVGQTSALHRHGVWDRHDGSMYVIARTGHAAVPRVPVHFQRSTTLASEQVMVVAGIPTTTVARSIIDAARRLSEHQLTHVIHQAAFHGIARLDDIDAWLLGHARAPGVATLRAALASYRAGSAGTRSHSEDHLLEGMHLERIPAPLVNNRSASPFPEYEPDFAWPSAMLVVEVDGAGHDQPGFDLRDDRQDRAFEDVGWLTLRYDAWRVWRERTTVIREISATLTSRTGIGARFAPIRSRVSR